MWSELPRAFTQHGLGAKTTFWDQLGTLTEHISATEHVSTIGKKLVNLKGLPYMSSKFGELWSSNG